MIRYSRSTHNRSLKRSAPVRPLIGNGRRQNHHRRWKGNAVVHDATRLLPDLLEIEAEHTSAKFELQLFATYIGDFHGPSGYIPIYLGEALLGVDEEVVKYALFSVEIKLEVFVPLGAGGRYDLNDQGWSLDDLLGQFLAGNQDILA